MWAGVTRRQVVLGRIGHRSFCRQGQYFHICTAIPICEATYQISFEHFNLPLSRANGIKLCCEASAKPNRDREKPHGFPLPRHRTYGSRIRRFGRLSRSACWKTYHHPVQSRASSPAVPTSVSFQIDAGFTKCIWVEGILGHGKTLNVSWRRTSL